MCLLAVASFLAIASCKKQDESLEPTLDANNMVAPQQEGLDPMVEANNMKKIADYPILEFIDTTAYNFGIIEEGVKAKHTFTFKNTGKGDLIIINAKASCGCTVPDWTKTPIKTGEQGKIDIVFNSAGKPGTQRKSITLTTNTEGGSEMVSFQAEVKRDPNSPFSKKHQ